MAVLAISLARSPSGFDVRHGAAALWDRDSGCLSSVAEERVTRNKAAAGWRSASAALLKAARRTNEDVRQILVVGCAGTRDEYLQQAAQEGIREVFSRADIEIVGHHEAHAALAAAHSTSRCGIAFVNDAGGDLLARRSDKYWTTLREQTTVWRWKNGEVRRVGFSLSEPANWGLGEFYRAVTHTLGFKSHVWSSKVMALAAHGVSGLPSPSPFGWSGVTLTSNIHGDPQKPVLVLRQWLQNHGLCVPAQIERDHSIRIAYWAQRVIEDVLVSQATACEPDLLPEDAIGFSGGVALNCVAMSKVARATGRRIVIPLAPGDTGLALGAILSRDRVARTVYRSNHRFLGPVHNDAKQMPDIAGIAGAFEQRRSVALWSGRSELGPRSLGNRSLLTRATDRLALERLRIAKAREWFQPFALSILRRDAISLFNLPRNVEMDGMSVTVDANAPARALLGGLHIDGTCRIQIVEEDENSTLASVLKMERALQGIGAVVNTSLNASGRPTAESPKDAEAEALALGAIPVIGMGT